MVIARTEHEAVVVGVFRTDAHLYLFQLLLEAARSIAEALEDTGNGRDAVVALVVYSGHEVFRRLAFLLLRGRRHEQLVQVNANAELVVFVEGDGKVQADAQVRGNELGVVAAAIGELRTDVADVDTPSHAAFAVACHEVTQVVHGNVGSEGFRSTALSGVVVLDVGEDEAQVDTHREGLAEHAAVACIEGELVGLDGHVVHIGNEHLAQAEVVQRGMHRTVVADSVEARHVGQVDVAHQLAQPRRVADAYACPCHVERVLGRVPVLRVDVGLGCSTDVAHAAASGIGSDGEERRGSVHGIEHILFVLRQDCLCAAASNCQQQQEADNSVCFHFVSLISVCTI